MEPKLAERNGNLDLIVLQGPGFPKAGRPQRGFQHLEFYLGALPLMANYHVLTPLNSDARACTMCGKRSLDRHPN